LRAFFSSIGNIWATIGRPNINYLWL